MSGFGLASINATLQSATGLIRELKRPRVSNEQFAAILRDQVQQANGPQAQQKQDGALMQRAERLSTRFLDLHDSDRDGRISLRESGLDKKAFAELDKDGDGYLSASELQAGFMNALKGTGPLAGSL